MARERISWHPALLPALQLTFERYLDALDIQTELPLTKEPLRLDGLIIKKKPETVIDNPLARIWRRVNIIEYKSPQVILTREELYKGLVYVFLYASLNKIDVTDMSLSVLVGREASAVCRYIRKAWRYEVTEEDRGIYRIAGLPFPVQIAEMPNLSPEPNMVLRCLNAGLDAESVTWAVRLCAGPHSMDVSAYIDVIARANRKQLEEILMQNITFEKIVEESVLGARLQERGRQEGEARGRQEGEARGRQEGRREERAHIAQNLLKTGFDRNQVAAVTGLDLSAVEALCGSL